MSGVSASISDEKTRSLAPLVKALRKAGISLEVGACGCCGSPSVEYSVGDGETVQLDLAKFDTSDWERFP